MERFRLSEFDGLNLPEEELDRRLNSEASLGMRELVRSMPDEPVNMAWRSELNEKLQSHIRVQRRRRRLTWIVSPAVSFGLAGALTFMFMARTSSITESPAQTQQSHLEESLVASFEQNLHYSDVSGVGLSPDEVVNRRSAPATYEIIDAGFDSL